MTSIPQNKQELEQAIELSFDKTLADYLSIPNELSREIGVEGNIKGAEVSVCDTLAYLIGWGRLVLKWHRLTQAGQPVDFPEKGYAWNELGLLAQSFHTEYSKWHYADLITEFKSTINDILLLVHSLSDHDLYHVTWYEKYTLGRMMQFNTSSPMKNIRTKVRKFKKSNGIK
ncbi:ClbS/DfsB family four-helix bundle protein [Pseudomonas sp. HK3]